MRTNLTSRTTAGTVLQSYTYQLGPAGNRRSVTEADGTATVPLGCFEPEICSTFTR